MRHRVKKRHFNRDTQHRQALLRNLVRSLIEHGQLKTTKAKAKEVKRLADKLISQARTDTLASRRKLHRFFGKRDVVNTLVERIAPMMKDRVSGFTRMVALGRRRGDNTQLVRLELVVKPAKLGTLKSDQDYQRRPAKKSASKSKATSKKSRSAKASKKSTAKKSASASKTKSSKAKKSTKKTNKKK
ncbi:MAG: 50S ribosomal protein L17 [Candidatus Pacebacteria bacterium]|nr:50S ribosomal protein L17 [Candidatus Paceibacterota bacterium]